MPLEKLWGDICPRREMVREFKILKQISFV
jgi:hypothetical protein